MPVIPDLPWTAKEIGDSPGVVYVTHLHLRRLRDVPAFLRDSRAIRAQTMASPGARSMLLRAQYSMPCSWNKAIIEAVFSSAFLRVAPGDPTTDNVLTRCGCRAAKARAMVPPILAPTT